MDDFMEIPTEKANYTYLLRCADGSLYCGWTNDLVKRLAAHNAGTGGRYTRSRLPVELVWYTVSETKQQAMRLEARIKQLRHSQKEALVCGEVQISE
ncbi:MAG: GIY-YIG nuclease family protein [Anaerovoracaceae bacterium]